MTFTVPARPDRLRNYPVVKVNRRPDAGPTQHILSVEFSSPDGRTWQAIGGGDTLATAIAFAGDSSPTDTTWQPVRWNDLYGD
jgi:hypothetical protein